MSESKIIPACIACKKSFSRVYAPTHPEGAVCFSGGAPYGSIHDQDNQIVGLDRYEIFVCDECWPEVRRTFAVGVKRVYPNRVSDLHFSPEQVDAAFEKAKANKHVVEISEMYDGETDGRY